MLKNTIVCVMIVAAAALGWEQLANVPSYVDVGAGTHITWGEGMVWGMFPTHSAGETLTYVAHYAPGSNVWDTLDDPMETEYLKHTSLTFQWLACPALFGIGVDPDSNASLYWYHPDLPEWGWDSYWIDPEDDGITLGNGACIAYVPNEGYDPVSNPVPGWIYCLPGSGKDFHRYWIPDTSDGGLTTYGYCPGPGAIIADQTPHFKWSQYAQPTQYRIQVSTNPFFLGNVTDTVLTIPEFEPSAKLSNGTFYWRSAAWTNNGWLWSSSHNFVLQGGWQRVYPDIPQSVGTGAAMAFDADAFGDSALIVLRGGGNKEFYEYNLTNGQWIDTLKDAPVAVHAGTSLTTHDPTGEWAKYPCAAFGGSDTSDCPYHYHTDGDIVGWVPFDTTGADPLWYSHFPEHLGSEASMAAGTEHMDYLVVGDHHFYKLEPPPESRDGGQAGVTRNGKANAHVIANCNGIEVAYQLPASAHVRAMLHDAVGRRVGMLDVGGQKAGTHRLCWNRDHEGRKLSAGAYFVLLDMGKEQARLKAVVR